jgi:carboxyl-terminal processing protease
MQTRSVALALARFIIALAVCSLSVPPRAEAEDLQSRAQERRSHDGAELPRLFDAVVDTVEKNFFDEALLKRIDWRARAQAARQSVLGAATFGDAVRQINVLLADLKTSHTALYTPDDYLYYILPDVLAGFGRSELSELIARQFWGNGPYYPGIGVFSRDVDGRSFVDGVLEGSPADRVGLKFGDEIVSVDGQPYSPIAVFRGKSGRTVDLAVRRSANGELQLLQVDVVPIRPTKAFADATEASARVIECNGRRVGYVHIWASAEPNSFYNALRKFEPGNVIAERLARKGIKMIPNNRDALLAAIGELPKPIDSLVVDMRGRVGGNIAVASEFLKALDGGSYWGRQQTIDRATNFRSTVSQEQSFRGRSALLIDQQTRSAAELMAYGYKRSGFGPVIGTRTAGAVSSGSLHVMPGDFLLYVAVAGHELNGFRLEGVGVTPDLEVQQPLPYAAGADPVLEASVELLAGAGAR